MASSMGGDAQLDIKPGTISLCSMPVIPPTAGGMAADMHLTSPGLASMLGQATKSSPADAVMPEALGSMLGQAAKSSPADAVMPEALGRLEVRMDQVCLNVDSGLVVSRITDDQGSWLCFKQLSTKLMPMIPRETLKTLMIRLGCARRPATPAETAFLYTSCAIRSRASRVMLCLQAGVLQCINLIKDAQHLGPVLQPFHILPAYQEDLLYLMPQSSSGPQLSTPQGLPTTLPANPVPAGMLNQHYSLPKAKRLSLPFRLQLASMEAWCKSDIQLDRPSSSICSATWDNISTSIALYLGFQYRFMDVAAPTLESFTDTRMLASFTAFKVAKDSSINSHTNFISHAKKVLHFLGRARVAPTTPCTAYVSPAKLAQTHDWLDRLRQQLVSHIPRKRKDIGAMVESGQWLPADQLVKLIQNFTSSTLPKIPLAGQCNYRLARTLHNVGLANCLFSHLPPVRLVCIRTLQTPSTTGCLTQDCNRPGCRGNRLVVNQDGSMHMLFSHYKVDRKWTGSVMDIKLPHELTHILILFLGKAHGVACGQQPFVFTKANGEPMAKSADMTRYWATMLEEMGCPAQFSPHMLRHIFVDERRGEDRVAGPQDSGAAMIMGNTEREWQASYDLNFKKRESQLAVDCMSVWRTAMLEKGSKGSVTTPPAVIQLSSDEE